MSVSAPLLCPYLGLDTDPHSVQSSATEEHRCYAKGSAEPIGIPHQKQFCLSRAHPHCPLYQRAVPLRPEPKRVLLTPAAVAPSSDVDAPTHSEPRQPSSWLDRVVVLVTLAAVLFAVIYFGIIFFDRPIGASNAGASAAATATRTSTPTALAAQSPTITSTPRPTTPVIPARSSSVTVTPPPGGKVFTLNPAVDGAGWVASSERVGNHFGDALIAAGVLDKAVYYGVVQVDLSSIPAGTKAVYAALELVGVREDRLAGTGTWQTKLVNLPPAKKWGALTFDDVRDLTWDYVVPPPLAREQLGKGKANRFELSGPLLAALERQFGQGKVTFRIEGPTTSGDDLFAWDSGVAAGSAKPVLQVVTGPLAEQVSTLVVIPCVPTPTDPRQRQAAAATATYIATVFGTPTPYPPSYITPVIVTATPTPETIFAAATAVARMTQQATVVGTATPTPINWFVPLVVTPTPEPANQATAVYQAALATAFAATTGTPTPLPCHVQVATATPTPSPTAVVIFNLPTFTPTPEPTATPSALPQVLLGKIGFTSDREGAPNVYVMDPDGKNVGRLTNRWAYDAMSLRQTLSSVTGSRLGVLGNLTTGTKIVLFGADGRPRTMFENSAINYDPVFASDGYNIVFVSTVTGRDEIYRMNRDGEGVRQLTTSVWEWNKRPTWSPDAARIAWWSNRVTGRKQIWVMNADGSEQINASNNLYNDWDPVWFR
ncbi:MAG: hypothetical protein ABI874_09635 [Chloroflexota bacterium]